MANRYSDVTPSAYSPLTFEEIAAVPAMKRKQHDEVLAKQELIRSGLTKVDPHSKYFDEAVRLKKGMTDKMDTMAEQLATQGINNDMIGKTMGVNREYQDLVSPTGLVGQINKHNVDFQTASAEYLKNATALGHSPEKVKQRLSEIQAQHTDLNKTPLYDANGRVIPFTIDKLPPKYVNEEEWMRGLFKEAGIDEDEFGSSGSTIVQKPGGSYVLTSGRKWGSKTNKENLASGLKYIEDRLNQKDTDIARSLDYNYRDVGDIIASSKKLSPLYLKTGTKDEQESGISGYSPTKTPDETELTGFNVDAVPTVNNKALAQEMTDGYRTEKVEHADMGAGGAGRALGAEEITRKVPVTNKTYLQNPALLQIAMGIRRTKAGMDKVALGSQQMFDEVKSYLDRHKDLTKSNRVINPYSGTTGLLFPNLSDEKTQKAANKYMVDRVVRGGGEMRNAKGELIDVNDIKVKDDGDLAFTYVGDMSPESQIGNIFGDPNQNIMAHSGYVVHEDGTKETVYISRDKEDFKTPQFEASKLVRAITDVTDNSPGLFHTFQTSKGLAERDMNNPSFKYNHTKGTYDMKWTDSNGTFHSKQNIPKKLFVKTFLDDQERINAGRGQ